MRADDDAGQQGWVAALFGSVFILRRIFAAAVHPFVRFCKQIAIHDLQLRHELRSCRFGHNISGVPFMADQAADIDRLELRSLPGAQTAFVEHPGHRIAAGSLVGHLFKYFPHPGGFLRVDLQVFDWLVALIDPPFVHGAVSVGHKAAGIVTARDDLADTVARAHRRFLALPRRLPEADVVHQLVAVALDALLALVGAPHLNTVLDKPFQHKRRFALDASQPVEHIDEQNVKFFVAGRRAQFLDHIAFAGGNLGPGHAFFGLLLHHAPTLLLRKLAAGNFLHRDVIVVDLALGGDPVCQCGPFGVRWQAALQCCKIGIVQPLLVGLGDLDLFSVLVDIDHRFPLYRCVAGRFPVTTTIL